MLSAALLGAIDHAPVNSLSLGDENLIQAFEMTTSHNDGPWQAELPDGTKATFYSQFEEDRMLTQRYPEWLSMRNGTYLEMGALDGYRLSNTLFFYESLGWRGMLVEPQPACAPLLLQHRPHDAIHMNASCSDFRTLEFQMPNGDACAAGSGGSDFVATGVVSREAMKPINVGCSPIGHMLRVSGVRKLDLWSLDVEGAELETLRGMDWDNIPVHVLLIEMLPGNNPKVRAASAHAPCSCRALILFFLAPPAHAHSKLAPLCCHLPAQGEAGLEEIRQFLHKQGLVNHGRTVGTSGYDELWENPRFRTE